jgi:hypothetical protein
MAASITNKQKSELEMKDHTTFKELVEICFFPRI